MKEPLFAEFPLDEYELRVTRARALMEEERMDALLLTQMENVRYVAGYLSLLWISKFRPLLALLPRDPAIAPALILPGQEHGNAKSSWIEEVAFYHDPEDPIGTVVNVLHRKGLKGKRVGVELGYGSRLGMAQVQWEELRRSLKELAAIMISTMIQEGAEPMKTFLCVNAGPQRYQIVNSGRDLRLVH